MSMNYSMKNYDKAMMAKALGMNLPISRKQSFEICKYIRYKKLNTAKKLLEEVISKKKAVPFGRYNTDLGHKPKIGPGSYPVKASKEILRLIENAEANAQFKGLNTSNLYINHIKVNQSPKAWHYGRKSRRRMKRATVEVVLGEKVSGEKKKND